LNMSFLSTILLQAIFKAPVPGDGQSCIAASCGSALKDMLARIMRSNTDVSKPWQRKLDAALRAIGADAVADSALRHIERAAARYCSEVPSVVAAAILACLLVMAVMGGSKRAAYCTQTQRAFIAEQLHFEGSLPPTNEGIFVAQLCTAKQLHSTRLRSQSQQRH
jgi:hypothetical protein